MPASFKEHIRKAGQIDGAGLRVDAEFKLADKIRCPQRAQVVLARKWSWTTLGVRGLDLAPLTPSTTWKSGDADVQFSLPMLQERRVTCEIDVAQGLPEFISFDNGSACCLNALAAAGELWPRAVYCRHQPPCQTPAASPLHSSLRRDAVAIVSDPLRRWHCQKILPCENPDYWLCDQCLAYAPARISAPLPLIPTEHQKTEPHVRGDDEDDAVPRHLAVLEGLKATTACIEKASVWSTATAATCCPITLRDRAWFLEASLRLFPT